MKGKVNFDRNALIVAQSVKQKTAHLDSLTTNVFFNVHAKRVITYGFIQHDICLKIIRKF